MRLPGFFHKKGNPFQSRIIEIYGSAPYPYATLAEAFGVTPASCKPAPPTATARQLLTIPEGERNSTLLSLAGGLVNKGFDHAAVNQRLQKINNARCRPPLHASEVDTIAARAIGYGSNGFAKLPHLLLDSPEWKALAPATHDIITTAFRRYNGSNNGNIALPLSDFEGRKGFRNKAAFYKHRNAAFASGILVRSNEGGNGQAGRKPDLIAIAKRWLPQVAPGTKNAPGPSTEKIHPYIDKQLLVK